MATASPKDVYTEPKTVAPWFPFQPSQPTATPGPQHFFQGWLRWVSWDTTLEPHLVPSAMLPSRVHPSYCWGRDQGPGSRWRPKVRGGSGVLSAVTSCLSSHTAAGQGCSPRAFAFALGLSSTC